MNIAIFGGAFNPIHKAHTTLAENVLNECNVEKVIFIPTFISPHKSMQYAVPFRLLYCPETEPPDTRLKNVDDCSK